ncbi:MAG TPA: TPM domain-containing protein [Candidatus Aminicenantes bacterium]|nr:TPM domain-containing protein [Candidatus Aminicenantes bacterium]
MNRRKLVSLIDRGRLKRAIIAAEGQTSGELRVSVAPFFWGNVEKAAGKAFRRLGMDRTRDRNAILFLVVPSRRRFAVVGDEGIHLRVGADFWVKVAEAVAVKFRAGDYTGGLEDGIATVGKELARHFPLRADDENELSDEVDFAAPPLI